MTLKILSNTPLAQTLEIKQSKFIAHLVPYDKFATLLKKLKQEHPKARHFVTAFRYFNEHDQIVEGSSDDGEPKGTSGKPSLHVIQGNELINVAVIIVRYFGGTRLGTGGLVRAYSEAVNDVVEASELEPYEKLLEFSFTCKYHDLSRVEYFLAQEGVDRCHKDFGACEVSCTIEASQEQLSTLKSALNRIVFF
ncbi:MAG: YigZ family protein [Campylobacterota bacterium]|nr:YigZ family protein [Campylobacterota bacterium]